MQSYGINVGVACVFGMVYEIYQNFVLGLSVKMYQVEILREFFG